MDDKLTIVRRKVEDMVTRRRTYDPVWQDIVELVRPNTTDFNTKQTPGSVRTERAYDSTAIDSCNELASGLHSFLTNPTERWFSIGLVGFRSDDYDEDGLAWLETVADAIYSVFGQDECGFNAAMHEGYLDLAAFGTSCLYQEYVTDTRCLSFKAYPMADCYFLENSRGLVDTVGRRIIWTVRQAKQEFPNSQLEAPKLWGKKNEGEELTFYHVTCPRGDRDIKKRDGKNKPVASFWYCDDTQELLEEGGYDDLPYHPGRWMKLAGDPYGVGPAKNVLPDIRMLNKMEYHMLKAGAKIVDPPLQVESEMFLLPIDVAPGGMIQREPGAEPAVPLPVGTLQWSLEQAEQKREVIRKGFYADWLRMEKENKEMTAFEVADRRNEKLQLLAPMMGRIQGEQLSPLIRRSYTLLQARGYFPPAPPSIQGSRLRVTYISPAARAQLAVKASEMGRYLQELLPIMQIDPSILDSIDLDKYAKKLAEYRGTTRTVMRPRAEVEQMRAQKQQAAQIQAMAQAAEPASKALLNVAKSQEAGIDTGALL